MENCIQIKTDTAHKDLPTISIPTILVCNTVESRYLELGYLESRVLSNKKSVPLQLIVHLYQFTTGYLELGYLETLAISNTL